MSCRALLAATPRSLHLKRLSIRQNRRCASMSCKARGSLSPELTYPAPILEGSQLEAPLHSDDMVFYTHVLCPFAERVWLCLLHHNVQHTLVCPFGFACRARIRPIGHELMR